MSCTPCTTRGRYDFNCVRCCARLIRNSRPSRARQEAQIAALARYHGVRWASVWVEVKNELEAV